MPVIRMPDGVLVRFDDNMSKEEIKAKIATKFPDFAASKGYVSKPALQLTDDQKAQIKANIDAYKQKQEANRPWADKSRLGRALVASAQGVANALGYKDKPFKAETTLERALEKGGEYGYDVAAMVPAGRVLKAAGLLGKGQKLTSKLAQALFAPSEAAIATAAAGGATEGAVNSGTTSGDILANLAGGLLFEGARSIPRRAYVSIAGGLENIAKDTDALRIVRRAAKYDDDIAKSVIKGASEAADNINQSSYDALEKVLNGVTNNERYQSVRKSYDKFVSENKGKKVQGWDKLSKLNPFQQREFGKALKKGLDMADYGTQAGTLGHLLEVRKTIDDAIGASYRQEFPSKAATRETARLVELKKKLDHVLEKIPFLEGMDKNFSLYKQFDDMYQRGLQYNPGSPKNILNEWLLEAGGDKEKQMMANFGLKKGLFDKLGVDMRPDKNFSKNAKNYQNVFKQILFPDESENLMNTLVENETVFNRLGKLVNTAENKLTTPEANKFFGREQWESKGALTGAIADSILGRLNSGYYKKAAETLLKNNGKAKVLAEPAYQQIVKNIAKGSVRGVGYNTRAKILKALADELKD